MSTIIDFTIPLSLVEKPNGLEQAVQQHAKSWQPGSTFRILKRSIDARHRTIKFNYRIELFEPGETIPDRIHPHSYVLHNPKHSALIIGAGPAGLFAALQFIRLGIRPIVVERGKDVQARRRDLAAIHKQHTVHPHSNYCFGEGGAGTYSDGKLYTRSTKRGDVNAVLETLVQFGASEDILIEAHPHIGTNKLPKIIAAIRQAIMDAGGEVHFETFISDFVIENNKIIAALSDAGKEFKADAFVLATGHSARDIFHLLHRKKIAIEFKPFALGVRAEHPQQLVDSMQYHCEVRPELLPAAAYSLVEQLDNRGVYSFCMCPGGIIAPCATAQEEVVTNGWSPSKRNNPWANSGIVVSVNWEDIPEYHHHGALAGLEFQSHVEKKCWEAAGKTQRVPAQLIGDFITGKLSTTLPECSYQPGVISARIDQILPPFIAQSLQKGFVGFGKKMKGYISDQAMIVAPESRTSSPVRIPRDKITLQHPDIFNLYPCGEGAGYAGGIISAAIDGEKIAQAAHLALQG